MSGILLLKKRYVFFILITLLCSPALFAGCTTGDNSPQKLYGENSNYYIGLRCLAENKTDEAARLFEICAEKGNGYAARRSMEQLALLGNIQDRIAACTRLIKKYPDESALLTASREYAADSEYAMLIESTDSVDILKCSSELASLRMLALFKKNDSRFAENEYRWFTECPMTDDHYKMYAEFTADEQTVAADEDPAAAARSAVIAFRIEVYRKSYRIAYNEIADMCASAKKGNVELAPLVISDMGKACLYGNEESKHDVQMFRSLAMEAARKKHYQNEFFSWFYAGRLYDRMNNTASAAVCYLNAMTAADKSGDGERYDNALWYLLNSYLAHSTDDAIAVIGKNYNKWHNPAYFDDFFDTLSIQLLSEQRWNDFGRIYKMIDGYATDEVTAKYAYIYGRLIQENLAVVLGKREEAELPAFRRALKAGSATYYMVLASSQLNLSAAELEAQLEQPEEKQPNEKTDNEAELLLKGYAEFGLPGYIYDEWFRFFSSGVRFSTAGTVQLAGFLRECGDSDGKYYPQSIRIASVSLDASCAGSGQEVDSAAAVPVSRELLKLVYPQDYLTYVQQSAARYGVPEEVMFALIRSESFFDATIVSSSGAVGLTQLMEFTAADIAQRLHRTEYEPTDPASNIEFGTYYLSSLIQRFNGSLLPAFFSYNAGISRVRRWIQSSQLELKNRLPMNYDLFLETIPYGETREYGRKIISAAALYGVLYYGKSASDVVSSILQ